MKIHTRTTYLKYYNFSCVSIFLKEKYHTFPTVWELIWRIVISYIYSFCIYQIWHKSLVEIIIEYHAVLQ